MPIKKAIIRDSHMPGWENTSARSQQICTWEIFPHFLVWTHIHKSIDLLGQMNSLLNKVNNCGCIWYIVTGRFPTSHFLCGSGIMTSVKISSPWFYPHPLLFSYRSFQGQAFRSDTHGPWLHPLSLLEATFSHSLMTQVKDAWGQFKSIDVDKETFMTFSTTLELSAWREEWVQIHNFKTH